MHTGELLEQQRTRAQQLGLVLLDKLHLYETIDAVVDSPFSGT